MDPKLLYWTGALVNLGVILACVMGGVRAVRRGEVRRHRRLMLSGTALVGLFFVSYALKVAVLGKEDRSLWTGLDYAVLYVHELCITAMLLAGAYAGFRAWRFRGKLGPALELPAEPLPGGSGHRRAGWTAAVGAVLAFVTAGGVLAGMFARSGAVPTSRNLVLISLDTLRADRLGLHGYERDTSPKLDAWSRESFVFERASSAGNSTVGAHHAIFRSRVASRAMLPGNPAPTLAEILRARGFRTAAFTDGGTMSASMGFARGFEHFDDGNEGLAESLPKLLPWLEQAASGDLPFYLFVHSFDVHLPYDPPAPYDVRFFPEYRGIVRGETTLPLLRGVRRIFGQVGLEKPVELGPRERRKVQALYDGEILKTDSLLARLLERLAASDLRDDTLVVVLSDHGEEFWEHGSVLHSHTLYEELLHVPLLLRVPRWRDRARPVPERVSMLDVLPTLLELLDVPAPAGLRGRSLVPLMRGRGRPPEPILAEGHPYGRDLQSVTLGSYKLIRSLETGKSELYDLEADPRERQDLSTSKPAERDRLLAVLDGQLGGRYAPPDPLERPEALPAETRRRLEELGYLD
jgi:arylsulfatase A-like enzyme/uncharacterized membrane protein YozB (DUF420 family)